MATSSITSDHELKRISAHFDLPLDEVRMVASGERQLSQAAAAKLAQMDAAVLPCAAEADAPAPVAAKCSAATEAPAGAVEATRADVEDAAAEEAEEAVAIEEGSSSAAQTSGGGGAKGRRKRAGRGRKKKQNQAADSSQVGEEEDEEKLLEEMLNNCVTLDDEPNKADQKQLQPKSDEIFAKFDSDLDGWLNFKELVALGHATGGELTEMAYGAVCDELGADHTVGVSKEQLLRMYCEDMGDCDRDYELIFGSEI